MIEVESDEVNPLSSCSHWRSGEMDKRITNMRSFLRHSFLKIVKAMESVWLTAKLIWKALISGYKNIIFLSRKNISCSALRESHIFSPSLPLLRQNPSLLEVFHSSRL